MNSINLPAPNINLKFKKGTHIFAICDFLSHGTNFAERYIKKIMIASNYFPKTLKLIKDQSNGEPDIVDTKNKKMYEIKTLWGQQGCQFLSSLKPLNAEELNKTFINLHIFKSLEEHFQYTKQTQEISYPKEIKNMLEKMQKKQNCDYILFYPLEFSPNMRNLIPATDVDSNIWQRILKNNNFNFTIYTIKSNFDNEFVLTKITKEHIGASIYFEYHDFFDKYYHFSYFN